MTIAHAFRVQEIISLPVFILRSLTKYLSNRVNTVYNWKYVAELELVDRNPMSSNPIDIIIGANLFDARSRRCSKKFPNMSLPQIIKYDTRLESFWTNSLVSDWVNFRAFLAHEVVLETLDRDLRRFWEIEEVPQKTPRSPEEHQLCEQHFRITHSRTPDGCYIVRLPFKNGSPISIGELRFIAISNFRRLEQRLIWDPITVSIANFSQSTKHSVIWSKVYRQKLSNQSKLIIFRITLSYVIAVQPSAYVFNALCCTSNGTSLNDHMLIGPKLQRDLTTVLMQWCQYCYVFTADIIKMSANLSWLPRHKLPAHCVASYPWRTNHRLSLSYRLLTAQPPLST